MTSNGADKNNPTLEENVYFCYYKKKILLDTVEDKYNRIGKIMDVGLGNTMKKSKNKIGEHK